MGKNDKPCYKCPRRQVTREYNCHSHCPDFKKIKDEDMERAELIRQKRSEDALIVDTRMKAIRKASRKTNIQNAWKGS